MKIRLFITTLLLPVAALAQAPVMTPCAVRGLDGDVQCTTIRVPEDRAKPNGRQLELFVVVARATGNQRASDPFVYLAGGPGQAASESGEFASTAFGEVRRHRDLVFIDARGTGRSNPLRCALFRQPSDLGGSTMYPAAAVRFCRDSLSRHADLTKYTSADIADDIEAVRQAFGWPALNFYGTSYGTRLAFTFLRRHESRVRTMTLKAVAPPSLIAPMNYADDAERAFGLLERDCRADSACVRAFPSLRDDLARVLALADSGRIRAPLPGGDTVLVTRDAVAATLMSAMQSVSELRRLPAALHTAAAGNVNTLALLVVQSRRAVDALLYPGMHLSVSCSEDARDLDLAAARRRNAETFLGDVRVRTLAEACKEWPVGPRDSSRRSPPRSRVPVLLVSGELDPNTPPHHAESALAGLPNARHIVLNGVAHNWSNVAACGRDMVAAFVATASVRELDVSCASRSSAPPFLVPSP